MAIIGVNSFSLSGLIKAALPVSFNQYWFFSVFIGLYIFSPFLNIVLQKLSNAGFQYLFGLCFVLFTITESIPGIYSLNPQGGNGIIWFFILYSVGAYLRRFPPKHKALTYFCSAMLCYLISFVGSIVIAYISRRLGFDGIGSGRLSTYGAFPIFFTSIAIVSMVLKCAESDFTNEKLRKVVLFFSGSAFSVYMIHENPLVCSWLWQTVDLPKYSNRSEIVLYLLLITAMIYIVCTVTDKLTWNQIKKLLNRIDTKRIDKKINTWLE